MKTMEDIEGDFYIDEETGETIYPGFIPRPTDQRINFSMFFQDYLPGKPNYKFAFKYDIRNRVTIWTTKLR